MKLSYNLVVGYVGASIQMTIILGSAALILPPNRTFCAIGSIGETSFPNKVVVSIEFSVRTGIISLQRECRPRVSNQPASQLQ
jgi:hypothetical protein